MDIILGLFGEILAVWYIAVPELIYAAFAGFCFLGPGGALGALLYLFMFTLNSRAAMLITGAVMAVHLVFMLTRSFIGDRLADAKKGDGEEEYHGVPKLSGDSRDIQDALDRRKQS